MLLRARGRAYRLWRRWPGLLWRLRSLAPPGRHPDGAWGMLPKSSADGEGVRIIVDRRRRELLLYEGERLVRTFRVGVGGIASRTPKGRFRIETKLIEPSWEVPSRPHRYGALAGSVVSAGAPENRLKARWLGVHHGVGIHGAEPGRLGLRSTSGCIILSVEDVIALFERVKVGTPVYID